MTYQASAINHDQSTLAKLPNWVTVQPGETPQNVAFLSGATFAMLDMILMQSGDSFPKALIANTLALKAAIATSKLEARLASEADIRDAYHLTPPDIEGIRHWGPDGEVLEFWRRAARLRLHDPNWIAKVTAFAEGDDLITGWLDAAMVTTLQVGPVAAAIEIMQKVLAANDRAERLACFLSDVVLAKSLGWEQPLPLTALHLSKAKLRDLQNGAQGSELAIQTAMAKSAHITFRLANQLAQRANALRAVAPKLRTRGSDDAVALFLSEDAVAPSGMLSPHIRGTRTEMSGRAARRFCDRLVELGVVKELTGRPTFRLYGIAP